jgi:peptidylprolyl isomerase
VAGKDRRRQIARERYERRLQERAAARARARQRWTYGGAGAAVVAIVGIVLGIVLTGSHHSTASASSPAALGSNSSGSAAASSPIPPAPTEAAGCTSKPSVVATPVANFPILPAGVGPELKTEPVVTIPAGPVPLALQTKDLVVGSGETAQAGDSVTVNYLGLNYVDCQEFDSSWAHQQEATFSLSNLIPGFAQGVTGMKVGGRREIIIPPSLGYGTAGGGGAIAPNEELVFVVDLLATTHASASPSGPVPTLSTSPSASSS